MEEQTIEIPNESDLVFVAKGDGIVLLKTTAGFHFISGFFKDKLTPVALVHSNSFADFYAQGKTEYDDDELARHWLFYVRDGTLVHTYDSLLSQEGDGFFPKVKEVIQVGDKKFVFVQEIKNVFDFSD